MSTHTAKSEHTESQPVSISGSQEESVAQSTLQLVNNRPEAIIQRKLQGIADNSSRMFEGDQINSTINNSYTQHLPVTPSLVPDQLNTYKGQNPVEEVHQLVKISKNGVDKASNSKLAKENMKIIAASLNEAAATVKTDILPKIDPLIELIYKKQSSKEYADELKTLEALFGGKHQITGLLNLFQTCQLIRKRRKQQLYLDSFARKNDLDECYVYLHPHDPNKIEPLGATNLGAKKKGVIEFSAAMAKSSSSERLQTIIHEHAHAIGYGIDDLGYDFETAMAQLEKSAPELTPHNADSIGSAGLVLAGGKGDHEKVIGDYQKRHKEIGSESSEDSRKKHILYTLTTAFPWTLRDSWPKKSSAKELKRFKKNYGLENTDVEELGGLFGVSGFKLDKLEKSEIGDVMYPITMKTSQFYRELVKYTKYSKIGKGEIAIYDWFSKVLQKSAPKADLSSLDEEVGVGKAEKQKEPSKEIIKGLEYQGKYHDISRAIIEIAEDRGAEDYAADLVSAFKAGAPFSSQKGLEAAFESELEGKLKKVAGHIADYLVENSE